MQAAIDAIEYAVKMGFRVSNNSWGGYSYSQALHDAIEAAGLSVPNLTYTTRYAAPEQATVYEIGLKAQYWY